MNDRLDVCPDYILKDEDSFENTVVGLCSGKDDSQEDDEDDRNNDTTENSESELESLINYESILDSMFLDTEDDEEDMDNEDGRGDLFDNMHDVLDGLLNSESTVEPIDPKDYESMDFSQLIGIEPVIDNVQKSIVPLLKSVMELKQPVPSVAGVMISGHEGTGKTHLALAIAAQLAREISLKVFRVRIGNPATDDIDFSDIRQISEQLHNSNGEPAILLIDDIPGQSNLGPETMMVKPRVLESLAHELITLIRNASGPLILLGTTDSAKDLPAIFFDISLFPISVKMKYPEITTVWKHLLDTAGLDSVDLRMDKCTKLTVRRLKHLLKFALVHARSHEHEQISQEDVQYACSLIKASKLGFDLPVEVPSVDLNDFVGENALNIVKEQLLLPIRYSDLAGHYGITSTKGVFITGPMGCGKTHLARCIAGELKWSLVHLNVGNFGSEYMYAHERQLHIMVEDWLGRQEPMVVLMDEVDNLVPLSAAKEDWAARTGNMVLLEIERLLHRKGEPLLVIAATNRPEEVNPALIRSGRLDLRIDLGFPDSEEREALFRLYLANIGSDLDISSALQQPYTPAEIERVAKRTLWHAFVRATNTGKQSPPNKFDLQKAVKQISPQDKLLYNRGSVNR